MLWGYAMPQPGEESWRIIWRSQEEEQSENRLPLPVISEDSKADESQSPDIEKGAEASEKNDEATEDKAPQVQPRSPARRELYSDLSIALTVMSIFVAFAISIIEFMGLALEKCAQCLEAAESSSGLDGRWWRLWAAMNDNSGYIGAGIVGAMLFCGIGFISLRKWKARQEKRVSTAT